VPRRLVRRATNTIVCIVDTGNTWRGHIAHLGGEQGGEVGVEPCVRTRPCLTVRCGSGASTGACPFGGSELV
jgi:hypothetical protein